MYDVTPIIKLVLTIIGILITKVLVPYIQSKTSIEEQKEINAWVDIAVAAAQQLFKGENRGEEKKAYVIKWLDDRNIKYDADVIDTMIEASVYRLKQNSLIPIEATPEIAQ